MQSTVMWQHSSSTHPRAGGMMGLLQWRSYLNIVVVNCFPVLTDLIVPKPHISNMGWKIMYTLFNFSIYLLFICSYFVRWVYLFYFLLPAEDKGFLLSLSRSDTLPVECVISLSVTLYVGSGLCRSQLASRFLKYIYIFAQMWDHCHMLSWDGIKFSTWKITIIDIVNYMKGTVALFEKLTCFFRWLKYILIYLELMNFTWWFSIHALPVANNKLPYIFSVIFLYVPV